MIARSLTRAAAHPPVLVWIDRLAVRSGQFAWRAPASECHSHSNLLRPVVAPKLRGGTRCRRSEPNLVRPAVHVLMWIRAGAPLPSVHQHATDDGLALACVSSLAHMLNDLAGHPPQASEQALSCRSCGVFSVAAAAAVRHARSKFRVRIVPVWPHKCGKSQQGGRD